ncbi:hypothetical protein [Novosphingobium sp. Gsoil 351]|uniref:hypothetical protein n=1 Tax=Novosphingobium sp. Gsoil 351 TaxID=2675225 RepID=UPI0012B4FE89|nr:hypothetical protein [Novosphingobium sp. Gsoil 351]QGN54766.1 hypothetical protein GKE62_09570 [Novosphingobium sp. Gsoil 351]
MVGPRPARRDGWTPARQGQLIGLIAETGSVIAACRRLGIGRESAYRLRARAGAAGFAAAWDAVLGRRHAPVDLASAKSTGLSAGYRCEHGLIQVVMYAGRYARNLRKPDNSALLQHLAQLDRALAADDAGARKSQVL